MKHLAKSKLTITLLFTLFLSGCTSFMAMTTDGPIVEDYGQRTQGTVVEDRHITAKAKINIDRANEVLGEANIQVKSFNKVVLLTGQVPDQASKNLAGEIATKVREVRRIHNEIEVAGETSFLSRTNDSFLSTKVKARLIGTDNVDSGRVEYVIENGRLYLMGLVTQDEADRIVESVQKVSGLQKIVKVFEYISAEPTEE